MGEDVERDVSRRGTAGLPRGGCKHGGGGGQFVGLGVGVAGDEKVNLLRTMSS